MVGKNKRVGVKGNTDSLVLTKSERLLIHRRRLEINQTEMAKKLKVSVHAYKQMEYGNLTVTGKVPVIGKLKGHERCVIYRRRSKGISQKDIAKELDCCRSWVVMMEAGKVPCDELVGFWES